MKFFESKAKLLTRIRLLNADMYRALNEHNWSLINMIGAKESLMFIEISSNSQHIALSMIMDKLSHTIHTHDIQGYKRYAHDLMSFLEGAYTALKLVSVNHLKLQMNRPYPMRCTHVQRDYQDVMENSDIMQEALSNLIANLGGTMDMGGYDQSIANEIQRAKKLRSLLDLQSTGLTPDYVKAHPMNWLISTRGY